MANPAAGIPGLARGGTVRYATAGNTQGRPFLVITSGIHIASLLVEVLPVWRRHLPCLGYRAMLYRSASNSRDLRSIQYIKRRSDGGSEFWKFIIIPTYRVLFSCFLEIRNRLRFLHDSTTPRTDIVFLSEIFCGVKNCKRLQ